MPRGLSTPHLWRRSPRPRHNGTILPYFTACSSLATHVTLRHSLEPSLYVQLRTHQDTSRSVLIANHSLPNLASCASIDALSPLRIRSNSGGQMPVTNSRPSVKIRLNRRQLCTDLLKLFENLLQQVFLHDNLLFILPHSAAISSRHS